MQKNSKSNLGQHDRGERQYAIKGSTDRTFGLIVGGVLVLVGVWLVWPGRIWPWSLIGLGGFLVVAGLVYPRVLAPLNRGWIALGLILNRIVSPLLLGLVFALFVVPTGLLLKLFGKDPMKRRFDPAATSYWIERNPPGPAPDSMKNQY